MPNWCFNNLTVGGDVSEIAKFNAWLNDEPLKLNKIVPMPVELENTTSPTPDPAYRVTAEITELSKSEIPVFSEEWLVKYKAIENTLVEAKKERAYLDDLTAKYGANNWYDWHIANWSTKWEIEAELDEGNSSESCVVFNFDSAWSPPTNAIIALSKLFPNLDITLSYREDGMMFAGVLKVGNGEFDDDYVDGDNKEDYRQFIMNEFGDDPFELEDEEEEEPIKETPKKKNKPAVKKKKAAKKKKKN